MLRRGVVLCRGQGGQLEMDTYAESLEAVSVWVAGVFLLVWSLCETVRLNGGERAEE